jgi:ArsR family metal-binding transcriptional regulator
MNFIDSWTFYEKGENHLLIGRKLLMWVITVYLKGNITMFELDTEKEAKEAFKNIQGCKILSEIVYFNDHRFSLEAV